MDMTMTPLMTAYIVDDSPVMQARLIELCNDAGFAVVGTAATPAAAVAGIAQFRPRIVLLDLRLREGNGLDVLHAIKNSPTRPVVAVLTSHPQSKYREASLALGADHFIHKSTEFERVGAVLNQLRGTHGSEPDDPQHAALLPPPTSAFNPRKAAPLS